jgi:hypothetical protein
MGITVIDEKAGSGSNPSVMFGSIPLDGQRIVLIGLTNNGFANLTIPAGFTSIQRRLAGTTLIIDICTRVASGETSATYSMTAAGVNSSVYGVVLSECTVGDSLQAATATVSSAAAGGASDINADDSSLFLAGWCLSGSSTSASVNNSFTIWNTAPTGAVGYFARRSYDAATASQDVTLSWVAFARQSVSVIAEFIAVPPTVVPNGTLPVVIVQVETSPGVYSYFSDGRYIDGALGIIAEPRLGKEISFERRVSTRYWGGGTSRAALGDIELINTDGGIDSLLFSDIREHAVTIWLGYENQRFNEFVKVGRSIIERVETIGESRIRIVLVDQMARYARAVSQNVYTTGDQIGRPYPVTLGTPLSVPALATDITNLRFSTHYNADASILEVRDRGAVLTPVTVWETYETAPHFGFRLLTGTNGKITANTQADRVNTSYGYGALPNIVPALLATGDTLSSLGGGVGTNLTVLQDELGVDFELGCFLDGTVNFDSVLDDIADSFGGWWYVDLDSKLIMNPLRLPSGSPVLHLTEVELDSEVTVSLDTAPGLSDTITGGRNWHVYSTEELAGSVRDTPAGIALTKDYRYRYTFALGGVYARSKKAVGSVREVSRTTTGRQDLVPGSGGSRRPLSDIGTPTLIVSSAGLATQGAREEILWAQSNYWFDCAAKVRATQAALLMPGECVYLTVPKFNSLEEYRYGLNSALLRVITVRGVIGQERVELRLWGPNPDPEPPEEEGGK